MHKAYKHGCVNSGRFCGVLLPTQPILILERSKPVHQHSRIRCHIIKMNYMWMILKQTNTLLNEYKSVQFFFMNIGQKILWHLRKLIDACCMIKNDISQCLKQLNVSSTHTNQCVSTRQPKQHCLAGSACVTPPVQHPPACGVQTGNSSMGGNEEAKDLDHQSLSIEHLLRSKLGHVHVHGYFYKC